MNDIFLKSIQYDFFCTLAIMKEEDALMNIYKNKFKANNLDLIAYQYKTGKLKSEVSNFIEQIFIQYILRNTGLLKRYSFIKGEETPIVPIVPKTINPYTSVKKLPTKYGKKNALEKIEWQGGTALPIDNLALAANDLRNVYEKVLKMAIHDIHREKQKLSPEKIDKILKGINDIKNIVNE